MGIKLTASENKPIKLSASGIDPNPYVAEEKKVVKSSDMSYVTYDHENDKNKNEMRAYDTVSGSAYIENLKSQLSSLEKQKSELDTSYKENGGWTPSSSNYNRPSQSQIEPYREWNAKSREYAQQIKDLENEIYQKERYHKAAVDLQEFEGFNEIIKNADFQEKSQKGLSRSNPSPNKVETIEKIDGKWYTTGEFGKKKEIKNILTFVRDNADSNGNVRVNEDFQKMSKANNDEVDLYSYLLETDEEKAQRYLDLLMTDLIDRRSDDLKERLDVPVLKHIASVGQGMGNYLESVGIADYSNDASMVAMQKLQSEAEGLDKYLMRTGQTIGNMLPPIMLSYLTRGIASGLGTAPKVASAIGSLTNATSVGISAKGSAYKQKIAEGWNPDEAETYSTLIGVSEASLEAILSGIVGTTGFGVEDLLKKADMIDNALLRFSAKSGIRLASEEIEEIAQLYLEPTFEVIVKGGDYDQPTVDELIETAIVTAISTGTLNSPASISEAVNDFKQTQLGKFLNKNNSVDKLKKMAIAEGINPEGRTSSNYKIGGLFNEVGQRVTERIDSANISKYKSGIASRLVEKGETKSNALKIADAIVKKQSGKSLSAEEIKTISSSKNSKDVLNDVKASMKGESVAWMDRLATRTTNKLNSAIATKTEFNQLAKSNEDSEKAMAGAYNSTLQEGGENDIINSRSDNNALFNQGANSQGSSGSQTVDGGRKNTGKRVYSESQEQYLRRTSGNLQEAGRGRWTHVKSGNYDIAYVEKKKDNSIPYSAVKAINDLNIKAVYCDGPLLSHKNGITTEHYEAITAPDGTIYVSSGASLSSIEIALHEVVHSHDFRGTEEYNKYQSVICDNLLIESETFKNIRILINENHYGGKYDIEDVSYAPKFLRELSAYINQFVNTDIEYTEQMFSGMFEDWNAVVKASQEFNKAIGLDVNKISDEEAEIYTALKQGKRHHTTLKEQRYIKDICESLGREVEFCHIAEKLRDMGIPLKPGEVIPDGFIDIDTGKIYMGFVVTDPINFILKHELTHFGEGSEKYLEFVNAVQSSAAFKKWLQQKTKSNSESLGELKGLYREMLRVNRGNIGDAQANTEMIGNFVGENLFADDIKSLDRMLKGFNKKEKNIIVKWISDFLSYLKNKLSGNKAITNEINALESKFKSLISSANTAMKDGSYSKNLKENTDGNVGVKYSIGYTTKNKPVAIIQDNILNGKTKNQWIQTVKETLKNKFANGIPISGRLIKVNKITRQEYTNSKYSKYLHDNKGTIYVDKLKSSNNIDDIILASTNYINEDLNHSRKDNIKEFARGEVLIRVGENDYSAKVIVGLTAGNEMLLYDIVDFIPETFEIRKDSPYDQSKRKVIRSGESLSDINVSQNEQDVNTNISKSGEENSKPNIKKSISLKGNNNSVENVNDAEYNNWESYELTSEFVKKVPYSERHTFLRSLANKTNGMKQGERRNIVIITDKHVYFYEATGYMNGSIAKRSGLTKKANEEIKLWSDYYGSVDTSTTTPYKMAEGYEGGKRRNDWDYDASKNSDSKRQDDEMAELPSKSNPIGDTWESNGDFGTDEELIVGSIVYNDNGEAFKVNQDGLIETIRFSDTNREGILVENEQDIQEIEAGLKEPASLNSKPNLKKSISLKGNLLELENASQYNINSPLSFDNRAGINSRSSINWVYKAEIFSQIENKLFHQKISEINQGSNAFERNSIGEYMLPIENKIVFTDGNYESPYISEILEVLTDYSTEFEDVKERIFDVEKGKSNKQEAAQVIADFYGDGIVLSYRDGISGVYAWENGRRKGSTRREVISNYLRKQDRGRNDTESNKTKVKYSIPLKEKENLDRFEKGKITQEEKQERTDELYGEAIERYGSFETGERAKLNLSVPKQVEDGKSIERFVRTFIEAGKLTPEMIEDVEEQLLLGEIYSYEIVSDKKAQKKAEEFLESGTAEDRWNDAVYKRSFTKNDIALGEMLLLKAIEGNDRLRVLEISSELSDALTRAGQVVQASRMFKKMSGLGRLITAQKNVKSINKDLQDRFGDKAPTVTLNPMLARQLANTKTSRDAEVVYEDVMLDIASQVPATWIDKLNAWRYFAMLANPLTHLRNMTGNLVFGTVKNVKDIIATGLEHIFIQDKSQRTKSIVLKKEYKDFAQEIIKSAEVKAQLSGKKFDDKGFIREMQQIFKNEKFDKFIKKNGKLLELEDNFFKSIHFKRAFAGFLQARNFDIEGYKQNLVENEKGTKYNEDNTLTDNEKSALLDYKSSESYKINAKLRDNDSLSDSEQSFVNSLDNALSKLPIHEGEVYRNISFDDFGGEQEFNAFLEEHKEGNIFQYSAYTSASKRKDGYEVSGEFTVSLIINSKNARDVDGYGNNFESEIIFSRESEFIVDKVITDENGKPIIYLTEVTENGTGEYGQFHTEKHESTLQSLQETQSRNDNLQGISTKNTTRNSGKQNGLQGISTDGKRGLNNLSKTQEEIVEQAILYAVKEAQKATFQDASELANMLNRIYVTQDMRNKSKTLSAGTMALEIGTEAVAPFKKTPINIVKRGLEYSPMGLIKGLTYDINQYKKGNITAGELIDNISAGITGIGIMAIGLFSALAGFAKGGFGDDKEDKFKKLNGEQEYSINIGGKSFTIDWAAPACIPFFIGVELAEELKENDGFQFKDLGESFWNVLEPITNLSMLSGVQSVIESVKYKSSSTTLASVAGDMITSLGMQMLPSVLSAGGRTIDKTQRQWYIDKNSPLGDFGQEFINNVKSKVPGLSFTQTKKIDEFGNVKKRGNLGERLLENFISPGYYSKVEYDNVSQALMDLYEATGEKSIFPNTAAKSFKVNGKTKYLTAKEYEQFSEFKGKYSYKYLKEFIDGGYYKGLNDSQRVYVIENIYEFSNAKAKTKVSDYEFPSTYKTAARNDKNNLLVAYYVSRAIAQ